MENRQNLKLNHTEISTQTVAIFQTKSQHFGEKIEY